MKAKAAAVNRIEVLANGVKAKVPLWRRWNVRWEFISEVFAQVPGDPNLVDDWLKARKPKVKPPGGKSIDEINEEVMATLEAGEEEFVPKGLLVFQRKEGKLVVRSATIKAHLKDCSRQLNSYVGKVGDNQKAFSTKVANYVYQDPMTPFIEITRPDGTVLTQQDGELDRPVHTFRGSSLKRIQFVNPPCLLVFDLLTTGNNIFESDLEKLFNYGGVHGYGGERSQDGGRYIATFKEIDY